MTKQEFDNQLKNGVSAPLCRGIGAWGCDFKPFEIRKYNTTDIDRLNDEQLSTVYRGIRFYFETPEQLQAFCEMIEDVPTVERAERLQNAVDLAVDYLEQVATHAKTEEDNFAAQVIKRKIDEIKQLTKGE